MYATIRYELCNGLIGGFLKALLDERSGSQAAHAAVVARGPEDRIGVNEALKIRASANGISSAATAWVTYVDGPESRANCAPILAHRLPLER
jgi:hypothetical protein